MAETPDPYEVPHYDDAERATVGGLWLYPQNVPEARKLLGAEDFWLPAAKAMFQAMCKVHDKAAGRTVSTTEYQEYVRGNGCKDLVTTDWIMSCIKAAPDNDEDFRWRMQMVREVADRRRVMDAAWRVVMQAQKGDSLDKPLEQLKLAAAPPPWTQQERLIVTNAEEVQATETRWLWKHRFVLGLNLVCGEPGSNKSSLLYDMTSRITRGVQWPRINNVDDDESVRNDTPRYVAILCAESAKESEIVPRLKAAQADLKMVKIIDGELDADGNVKLLNLTKAVDTIRRQLHDRLPGGLAALFIDPIGDFLPGVDSNSDDDVAPALQPLIDFAHECGVCVVMIKHDNKVQTTSAMNKVAGAGAFIRKTRAAWYISKDRTTPGIKRRLMLPLRITGSPHESGMAFISVPSASDPTQPCLEWEPAPVDKTADEAVTERMRGQSDGRRERKQKEVEQLVVEYLTKNGPSPSKALYEYCEQHGFKKSTVQSALHRLKADTKAIGKGGAWHWKLSSQEWDKMPLEKAAEEGAAI